MPAKNEDSPAKHEGRSASYEWRIGTRGASYNLHFNVVEERGATAPSVMKTAVIKL